jgi:hypothetical protein
VSERESEMEPVGTARYFYSNYVFDDGALILRTVSYSHPHADPRDRIERLTKDNDWEEVVPGAPFSFEKCGLPYSKICMKYADHEEYESWVEGGGPSAGPPPWYGLNTREHLATEIGAPSLPTFGVFEREGEQTLRWDDCPGQSNPGIVCAGFGHLEKHGFKEGDRVRVTVRIEKL